jgi:EAL domain-containing protein (putative c-di-GMP-specific phosphodiesterase class I)
MSEAWTACQRALLIISFTLAVVVACRGNSRAAIGLCAVPVAILLIDFIGFHLSIAGRSWLTGPVRTTFWSAPGAASLAAVPGLIVHFGGLALDGYHGRSAVALLSAALSALICVCVWLVARDHIRRHESVSAPDPVERSALARALAQDHLSMHHQPIVRLSDGRTVGSEALIRWHRDEVLLSGGQVLAVATHSGMTEEIERWAIRRAIRDGSQILNWLCIDEPYVTFNVSPVMFVQPGLASDLAAICTENRCSPDGFVIELTETASIDDWDQARQTVTDLQSAGFMVAVDDFGAGHANLVQLQHLDIDLVKFDRELVVAATTSIRGRNIATGAAALIRQLGVLAIAEGVEVQAMGCQFAQGFGIARPMSLDDLRLHLAKEDDGTRGAQHPVGI